MKKRVVLVEPRNNEFEGTDNLSLPASALYLAEFLLNDGYDVKIMDVRLHSKEEIIDVSKDALCVGFKIWTGYPIKSCLEIARSIKENYPNIPLVWGGWHASMEPMQTIQDENVDIVVVGPGEFVFHELIKRLDKRESLKGLKGVVYKDNGSTIHNGIRPDKEADLNKSEMLPYHLVDVERYIEKNGSERAIYYTSSRGCHFGCTFCADEVVYKSRLERSPEKVLKDMEFLINNFNVNTFVLKDTNFFINRKHVKNICQGIVDRGWKIRWSAYIRADQFVRLGDELLTLIRESGCKEINVGAESGSNEVLKLISKGIGVGDIIQCAKLSKRYGIACSFSFMLGLPTIDGRDIPQTFAVIRKIKEINPRNTFNVWFYTPYPATPLFPTAIQYGFKAPKKLEDWADHNTRTEFTWITPEMKKQINKLTFYIKLAYPDENVERAIKKSFIRRIAHKAALFRFRYDFMKAPTNLLWEFYYVVKGHRMILAQD